MIYFAPAIFLGLWVGPLGAIVGLLITLVAIGIEHVTRKR